MTPSDSGPATAPADLLSDPDRVRRVYRQMGLIRAFEERLHVEVTSGEIPGFVHLYAGQEAVAVGVCEHLGADDHIASTHRGHGHSIAKGCDVTGMMLEIFGRQQGLGRGKGGSMHIADLSVGMLGANGIVGGGPPLAVGAGLSAKTLGTGGVAAAFSGDGASNQGTTLEAMNMAVVLQLPVLFVLESNGYGEATGTSYAVGAPSLADRAAGFGMPAVTVDGTDVVAVYDAAGEAVRRAREGGGPSTIVAEAERWYGHFEGDPMLYRTPEHVDELRKTRDPLLLLREKVDDALVPFEDFDAIDAECAAVIDDAVTAARAAALPDVSELTTNVYVSY